MCLCVIDTGFDCLNRHEECCRPDTETLSEVVVDRFLEHRCTHEEKFVFSRIGVIDTIGVDVECVECGNESEVGGGEVRGWMVHRNGGNKKWGVPVKHFPL